MANLERIMKDKHWADKLATKVVKNTPNKETYLCSAGITPSGVVHIGNFRDIITSEFVMRALQHQEKQAELYFFWDDFDRLRKIPEGVPESFSKYLGMPVSEVPDPYGCHDSYSDHFKADFEEVAPLLGINVNFVSQAEKYNSNTYLEEIKIAMQKRKDIAKILAKYKTQGMTNEEIENFYPLQIYCSKCRKDSTTITNYDKKNLVDYTCECGHKETADISKKNVGKLQWKIDWPMRWKHYGVCFEPGGSDHATMGGSYTIAKEIAERVFNIQVPLFQEYGFVGVEGIAKMSSSAGTGISPKDMLKIYQPAILRWMFARTRPKNELTLHFGSELIRQYNEFDKILNKHLQGKSSEEVQRILNLSNPNPQGHWPKVRVPFRQTAAFGQIAQGNFDELKNMYKRIGQDFEDNNLRERLEKSQAWVDLYAPEHKINVRNTPNKKYFSSLSEEEKSQIFKLRGTFGDKWSLEGLTTLVYDIPKKPNITDKKKIKRQKKFFKNVYQLMIDSDTGPRLPTFMLALTKQKVKKLLNF